MLIGNRIKSLRETKNLTQSELAKKLFVSDKAISSWENDRTEPSLELIVKLSDILDCSVGYLIYGDANNLNIETEIRIKLEEKPFHDLELFFQDNATFVKNHQQIDTYYQSTHRKFLKDGIIDEWLRIGCRGSKIILNYKNWHEDKYCDEYEVELNNYENMDKILQILGMEIIATVDKTRTTFLYLDKYEIALDKVKDLGYFIEIEIKKYETSAVEEYDNLIKLAKQLNLNLDNVDKRGYAYHLIYNKK